MTEPGDPMTTVPDAIRAAEELLDAMPAECVLTRTGHAGVIVRLPKAGPPAFNVIEGTGWVANLREAACFAVEVFGFRPRRSAGARAPERFLTDLPRGFVVATVRADWRLLRTSKAFELIEAGGNRRECTAAHAASLLVGDTPREGAAATVRAHA